jgi:hypothetical protein
MEHEYELVWLTDELQGLRCKECGKEILDIEDDKSDCIHKESLCHSVKANVGHGIA